MLGCEFGGTRKEEPGKLLGMLVIQAPESHMCDFFGEEGTTKAALPEETICKLICKKN